jgi:histidinol-phosphate aminotransferase
MAMAETAEFPAPRPGVLDISPYVGGRASAGGAAHPIKLSSNESALGPGQAALAAFAAAAANVSIYPEGSASILRDAVCEVHGLDPARIVCGNGSDELIELLCTAYLRPGDETVISQYAFSIYEIDTRANGAAPVIAPAKDFACDADAMLAAVTGKTRMVFLANPNNPTGTYMPVSEVRRLHAGLPRNVLLILDAAYAEFVRKNDYEAGIEMVSEFDNVVMTRTFSKVYALAGLRIGWAYCPAPVADALNRIRAPFNVSVPAQAAGAAAMRDRAHVAASVAHNEQWRAWLLTKLRAAGLRVDDSVANFLLIHFPHTPGKTAHDADAFLCSRGLILRGLDNYGLPDCLRLTVGREDANRKVAAALEEFMGRK